MTMKIQRWGNSLAIRIPSHVAKSMAIEQGSEMEMTVDHQEITLKPKKQKPTLEELLSQCKPENRHEEIDFGGAGKELL
ncbi:MAG TPA: AbrB/MazE/SpoVT family DNA-binding domain-containing protein [Bacillales bacterium]|nr:AbrB/MazE/SpoVT family DNA-binding domain-containing protein [Bacillales bacterium]